MTTDIEKQFFETFGIEPRTCIASCDKCEHYSYDYCLSGYCTLDTDYNDCGIAEKLYPQITDRILLELICILSKYKKDKGSLLEIYEISLNELKEEILEKVIFRNKDLNYQVHSLFKEG